MYHRIIVKFILFLEGFLSSVKHIQAVLCGTNDTRRKHDNMQVKNGKHLWMGYMIIELYQ